jgi:hypothetical protein
MWSTAMPRENKSQTFVRGTNRRAHTAMIVTWSESARRYDE